MAGQQLPLFGQSLDVALPLKRAMAAALRQSPLSREQIVDRLNELLSEEGVGLRVTINMLEKWVAPSARHMIPVQVLPFFCRVVGSARPVEVLAGALGLRLAGPREQHLIALGEAALEAKRASAKRRRALEALEELGQ